MSVKQNARVYWEMYGGIPPSATSQYVHVVDLTVDVGGWAAADHGDYFQFSVYGRAWLGGANLVTLYQRNLTVEVGEKWKHLHVFKRNSDTRVQCVVGKLELVTDNFVAPDPSGEDFKYDDQYDTADAPPWGVRVKACNLYCTDLHGDVRLHRVLADIVEGGGFTYSGPTTVWEPDQLCFSDLPKDRWEALDEVNGMLGWNYHCWDGETVEFSTPKSGTARTVDARDPRSTWNVQESLDETFNEVRVQYQNAKGKPREVVLYGDKTALGGLARRDTLQAPDSIKSLKGATRFGSRYLRAHEGRQVYGTLTLTGYETGRDDFDPLLVKPGDTIRMTGPARFLYGTHEVTAVSLRPLEWTAEIQFGANSRRFDTWLARLAAGVKRHKRR
jgi:hypothetical protein